MSYGMHKPFMCGHLKVDEVTAVWECVAVEKMINKVSYPFGVSLSI